MEAENQLSKKTKSKRWNVVAIVNGVEVKFVVRGDTQETAKENAFANYKGITDVISLQERDVKATYPISEQALRREAYTFEMRSDKSYQRKHSRVKIIG